MFMTELHKSQKTPALQLGVMSHYYKILKLQETFSPDT